MSDTEMENEGGAARQNVHELVERKMQTAFAKQKEELLREMGNLFEKISQSSNSSQLDKINSMLASDTPKFKRKSNEEQFRFNAKVSLKLSDVEQSMDLNPTQAMDKLTEAKDMKAHRQKLIKMADSNELGWRMVQEYESNPLADDSDDERRMYKAEARASKKLKAERARKTKQHRTTPYRRTESQPSATATATSTSALTKPGVDLSRHLGSQIAAAGIYSRGLISSHMADYVLQSHADSTVKKYSGYFKSFSQFCVRHSLADKPADSMTVATFLTQLLDEGKSYSVISAIVYSIKWMHSIFGLTDPTNNSIIQHLLLAAKRLRSKPVIKKDVIDSDELVALCTLLQNDSTLQTLRDLCMILVCYAGFLRFNEMISLLCSDVCFTDDHVKLKIRQSKTDIFRQGREVLIVKGKTLACPYNMLKRYMSSACLSVTMDCLLFRPMLKSKGKVSLISENKPLSYTRTKECIVSKLKLVAPGLKLGTHSLRASGATSAANAAGISDRCLKKHGRWKTDTAKDGYIVDSLEKRLMVSRSLNL